MGTLTPSVQETITNRVANVPMLPHVVSQLLAIIGGKGHSLEDVVKIVQTDASLTTRMLRIANSAAFYRGQPVTTLSRAILHLGEKMVAGIAIGSCTTDFFHRELEGYKSGNGEFWDHSLCTAIASREIAAKISKRISAELAFTAGLLHDIGKVILSEFLKDHTEKIEKWCSERQAEDFIGAEKDIIGADHSDVGYILAHHWKLPDPLCEVIKHHHHPWETEEKYRELVYVVHIGDQLAMLSGAGTGVDSLSSRMHEGYEEYFEMDREEIPVLLLTTQHEFSHTKNVIFADEGI